MEVVENIEEGILRGRSDELMDVIHNEDINPHVISHEIRELVLVYGVHVLGLELISSDI